MSESGQPTLTRPRPAAPWGEAADGPPSSPGRALALPCAFALALAAFVLFPPVRADPNLPLTFLGAAGGLLAWTAALYVRARNERQALTLHVVAHKHHYVQAAAQMTVLLYWGWHVAGVFDFLPLILGQLVFAYGFDSLLSWSRRDRYALGFGPFPIILSINLFLWFKPEWFYWQFVMIAVGYLAKELIRWQKDGRSAHIFNPSSFPLGVASLALILTGATDMTWGLEIATTQFNPPNIYLVIFLAALPGQLLFGVTTMTMSAVVTTYTFGLLYFAVTGTYLFRDAFISLPVFLGMHLLFTDPSTSPRTESGRIMFGVLYGLGTTAIYSFLVNIGVPPFYDKLLPVPIMNLMIRRIDLIASWRPLATLDASRLGRSFTARQRNLVYVGIWAFVFAGLTGVRGVGDTHPGQWLPFWEEACEDGKERACDYAAFMKWNYCDKGSGWACNELGIQELEEELDRSAAVASVTRGCELGFPAACENTARVRSGVAELVRAPPDLPDLPIVLRGSKGPILERDPARLFAMGCEQGWPGMCQGAPLE